MGSCCHPEKNRTGEFPPISDQPTCYPDINSSSAPCSVLEWQLIRIMQQRLKGICLTSEKVQQFAQIAIDAFLQIQSLDFSQSKQTVSEFFQKKTIQASLNSNELPYHSLIDKYKQLYKGQHQLSKQQQYRIYHALASCIKFINWKNSSTEEQEKKENPVKYTRKKIDHLVKLECIEDVIERAGDKFKYALDESQKEAQQMQQMLKRTLEKYRKDFDKIEFDLTDKQEWKKAAEISRYACEFHEKGIYFLIVYMVRAIDRMEEKGKSVDKIQQTVGDILKYLGKEYPPGQKLAHIGDYKKTFKNLQFKIDFKTDHQIDSSQQKIEQLKQIILTKAATSSTLQGQFETLIVQCCLKESLWSKTGLKISPIHPNPKAMIRIFEKMLFNKELKTEHKSSENIAKSLQKEELFYKETLKNLLKDKETIEFKVSDLLRAKCIFSSIQDILNSVQVIKQFIEENSSTFKLLQVQNRFTSKNPISDITLKILVKNEIVAQLQLTLQNNLAVYNFAHKIYEFCRSKIFSKIKTLHNYFKEYEKEMTEMITAQIQRESVFSNEEKQQISKYFSIKNTQLKLSISSQISNRLNLLQVTPSQKQRFLEKIKDVHILIELVFKRKLNLLTKQLAKNAQAIEDKELKSMVCIQFIRGLDPIQDIQKIKIHNYYYWGFLESLGFYQDELQQISCQSYRNYLQFLGVGAYFQSEFTIVCVPPLQQFYGPNSHEPIYKNFILGQFYVLQRNYDRAQQFYRKASEAIKNVKQDQQGSLSYLIQLKQLELGLKTKKISKQTLKCLQAIQTHMKKTGKSNTTYAFSARLLKAQYILIYLEDQENFKVNYSQAKQMAKLNAIPYSGEFVNQLEYRIWSHIIIKPKSSYKKKDLLDNELREVLYQFGRYREWQQIYDIWNELKDEYKKNGLKKPEYRANWCTTDICLYETSDDRWEILLKIQHKVLQRLSIFQAEFTEKDCKFLKEAKFPYLKTLQLKNSTIGDEGCKWLIEGSWPHLEQLNLEQSDISDKGCEFLARGKWPNLKYLNLLYNKISEIDICKQMLEQSFPEISLKI